MKIGKTLSVSQFSKFLKEEYGIDVSASAIWHWIKAYREELEERGAVVLIFPDRTVFKGGERLRKRIRIVPEKFINWGIEKGVFYVRDEELPEGIGKKGRK